MVRVGLTVSKIEARLGLRLPVGSGLGQGYKRGRKGRSARGIITLLPRFSLETLHSVFWGGKTGRDFLGDGPPPTHTHKVQVLRGVHPPKTRLPQKTSVKFKVKTGVALLPLPFTCYQAEGLFRI